MSIPRKLATTIVLSSALATSSQAYAQVKLDVTEPDARKAAGIVYLEDLSVNDKAFIYNDFCVKDG